MARLLPSRVRSGPRARRQQLEMMGGFLGFFTVIALINAVGLIATGRPSILASVVLVFFLTLSGLTFRAWRLAGRHS